MDKIKEIKVSFIIPVYNMENYIEKCLDSITSQTYKNIEIICVNDGSSDNSLEKINGYKKKDNRIVVINQTNSGANIARKNGILNCTGDYLMFIDADDWILNNTVQKLVEKIQKNNADIVKFNFLNRESTNFNLKIDTLYNANEKNELLKTLLTTDRFNNLSNEIVNRNLIDINVKVFSEENSIGEDLLMNLEIFDKSNRIVFTSEKYYYYSYNPDSTTNTINKERVFKSISQIKKIYDNLIVYAKKWNLYNGEIERDIIYRSYKAILENLVRILEHSNDEDILKIDEIVCNNKIIEIAHNKKIKLHKKDINVINRKIYISLLNKEYKKAKLYLNIKIIVKRIFKIF